MSIIATWPEFRHKGKKVVGRACVTDYAQWHEMAERLSARGVKQILCSSTGKWEFPKEHAQHDSR